MSTFSTKLLAGRSLLIYFVLVSSLLVLLYHTSERHHTTSHELDMELCRPRAPQVIVYTRNPKSGGTFMYNLIAELSTINGYEYVTPYPFRNHTVFREAIFSAINSGRPTVIQNHFSFPEIFYSDKIAYINVIREPTDSYVSHYYYHRYGAIDQNLTTAEAKEKLMNNQKAVGTLTIDECLDLEFEKALESCIVANSTRMIRYFCGMEGGTCDGLPEAAMLERSLKNLQHYVVGITEDLNSTAALWETLFPTFFKGMGKLMRKREPRMVTRVRPEYVLPNKRSRSILKSYFWTDVAFYSEARTRFQWMVSNCL